MDDSTYAVSETDQRSIIINIEDPESYITKKGIIEALRPFDSTM